jgi:hypothetical protein
LSTTKGCPSAIEQDPGHDVARAAAGKWNDDLDRSRRIALRTGHAAAEDQKKRGDRE